MLLLGEDLLEHMRNLFGVGEKSRRGYLRKMRRKPPNWWRQQLSLLDKFSFAILSHAKEIQVKLDGEGWERLADIAKKLELLSLKAMK